MEIYSNDKNLNRLDHIKILLDDIDELMEDIDFRYDELLQLFIHIKT